jgi:hypothetical protein
MPYVSEEEQEQQKWMTLKEAISHIQRVDRCDEVTALQQLRKALANEAVEARFKISATSRLYAIDLGASFDPHWPRKKFWLSVPMDLEGDGHIATVTPEDLDDEEADHQKEGGEDNEDGDSPPRRLFIRRSSILGHWEGPLDAIRQAAREVYDEAGEEGPNVNDAYLLIREKLAATSKIASRDPVREVLDEDEFKNRRRGVGRRLSKK